MPVHIRGTDSQRGGDFGGRIPVDFLQDKHVPASGRKQQRSQHDQLKQLCWFGVGAACGGPVWNWLAGFPVTNHPSARFHSYGARKWHRVSEKRRKISSGRLAAHRAPPQGFLGSVLRCSALSVCEASSCNFRPLMRRIWSVFVPETFARRSILLPISAS